MGAGVKNVGYFNIKEKLKQLLKKKKKPVKMHLGLSRFCGLVHFP